MKAQRRHALQENVLALEIGKVAEFLKKRGNHLATAALLIALVVAGYKLLSGWHQRTQLGVQHDWQRAVWEPTSFWGVGAGSEMGPEERAKLLTSLAQQDDNERIAALASVKLGNLYSVWSLGAKAASERSAMQEKAASWYLQAIQKFPKEHLAVAQAHYGLAKLRESTRQFGQAGEHYRLAKAAAGSAGQPVAQLAEVGIQQLKALQDAEVRMAATQPAPAATTQPAASRPATTQPAAGS